MSHPESPSAVPFEPPRPALVAGVVCVLAALVVCWPMLTGQWLLGDDQYVAGYGFRLFGAEMFRATGRIPEWNPYLFGGLPFIAAQHGDIFYPTAWLRWVLPIDTAMNLGFFAHIALAGATMYAFLRALRVRWTGAMVGGLAYELSGIVASMVRPGHDGKLYVSALAPLVLLALLRAIRDRRPWGYGLLALTVGLCMLSPHYQMTYYLLVAAAVWTLYLVFLDPDRPAGLRWPLELGLAFGAVLLGLAIAAIQVLPFLQYIPYSPRGAGGPSGGWDYAVLFSMPPEELMTTVLPQFNGMLDGYWGRNFFKLHTEYLGAIVVVLAALGLGDRSRRRLVQALGAIAILFLLVSFGGHTPFYYLWYEVMPMMKKVRAPGMAFFLVALPVAAFAGFGTERLLRGEVTPARPRPAARRARRPGAARRGRHPAIRGDGHRVRGAGLPGRRQRRRSPGRVDPAARRGAGRRGAPSGRCGADGSGARSRRGAGAGGHGGPLEHRPGLLRVPRASVGGIP